MYSTGTRAVMYCASLLDIRWEPAKPNASSRLADRWIGTMA